MGNAAMAKRAEHSSDAADSSAAFGASDALRAAFPSLHELDLSHLTAEERTQIEIVLGRQYAIEMEEEDRIRALKKELFELERSVANRKMARGGIKACFVCSKALARPRMTEKGVLPESTSQCDECGNVCCLDCGATKSGRAVNETEKWFCEVCGKKREFIMKSNLWHSRSKISLAKENGSLDLPSDRKRRSASPNPVIMLTSPDFDANSILFNAKGDDASTGSATGSSEVGGFTPPSFAVDALGSSGGSSYGGVGANRKAESRRKREKMAEEVASSDDGNGDPTSRARRNQKRRRLPEVPADAKPWTSPASAAVYRARMRENEGSEEDGAELRNHTTSDGDGVLTEARVSRLLEQNEALYAVSGVSSQPPPLPLSPPPPLTPSPEKGERGRADSGSSVDDPAHPYARIEYKVRGEAAEEIPDPGYAKLRRPGDTAVKAEEESEDSFGNDGGYSTVGKKVGTVIVDQDDSQYTSVPEITKKTKAEESLPSQHKVDNGKLQDISDLYAKVDKSEKTQHKVGNEKLQDISDLYAKVDRSKKTKAKAKAKDKDKDKDPSAIYAKVDKSKKKKKKEKEAREDPVGEKKQSDEEPEKPKDVISLFLGDSEKEKLAQEQPGKTKTARHFLVKKPEWRKGREMSRSQSEEVRSPKGLVKARKAMFEGMSSKASTLPKTTTEENQDERTGKPEKATEETWNHPSKADSSPQSFSQSLSSSQASISSATTHTRDSPKPPVIHISNEEIVDIVLSVHDSAAADADPGHPFGLHLGPASNGIRVCVQGIDSGSPADLCSKIDIGDEIVSVKNISYLAKRLPQLEELLVKEKTVKMKIRHKLKKGSAFKEKIKEKQRELNSEFSLAEAVRAGDENSGGEVPTLPPVTEIEEEQRNESVSCLDSGLEAELSSPIATSSPSDGVVLREKKRPGRVKAFFSRLSRPFGNRESMLELRSTSMDFLNVDRGKKTVSLPRKFGGSMNVLNMKEDDMASSLSDSLSLNDDLTRHRETTPESECDLKCQNPEWHLGKGQMVKARENEKLLSAGKVYLSIMHMNRVLTVEMIEARDLIGQRHAGAQIPYAKVYLLSSGRERLAKQKTKQATRAVDPAFYDRMYFKDVDLEDKCLKVMIWRRSSPAVFSKKRCVGQALISLSELQSTSKVTNWYELFVPSSRMPIKP
eukprot:m.26069 g.26069  ORF g.26069 m.26069 type:complete len:1165 (+) comp29106_c1_seq4:831-4325(+)